MSTIASYSTAVKSVVDTYKKISERAKVAAAAGTNLRTQIMQYKGAIMPYKKASEPVVLKNLICTIISQPGAGKTSLCSGDSTLLINCDANRIATSALGVARVEVDSWPNVTEILTDDEIRDNFKSGKWNGVAFDTFGRLIEFAKLFAAKSSGNTFRHQNLQQKSIGNDLALTFQGWSNVRNLVVTLIRQYQLTFDTDIILTAHAKFYCREGYPDDMVMKAEGQSKQEMLQRSALVGSLTYWNKTYAEQHATKISFLGSDNEDYQPYGYDNDSTLVLDFNPYPAFTSGKNPSRLAPIMVPDLRIHRNWFVMLIQLIKDAINQENAKKAELALHLETQQGSYNQFTTTADFNKEYAAISNIKNAELRIHLWGTLISTAAQKKFFFSREKKQFIQSPN